jgi:hypothetical protein
MAARSSSSCHSRARHPLGGRSGPTGDRRSERASCAVLIVRSRRDHRRDLTAKGVRFISPLENQGFGLLAGLQVPRAGEISRLSQVGVGLCRWRPTRGIRVNSDTGGSSGSHKRWKPRLSERSAEVDAELAGHVESEEDRTVRYRARGWRPGRPGQRNATRTSRTSCCPSRAATWSPPDSR